MTKRRAQKAKKTKKPKRTKPNENTCRELIPWEAYILSGKQRSAITFLSRHGYRPGQKTHDGTLTLCCQVLNIGRTTLYEWLQVHTFIEELEKEGLECEDALYGYAKDSMTGGFTHAPNAGLIAKFLDARYPEIYDPRIRLAKLKHLQQIEILKLTAELKLDPGEEEDYQVNFRVTGPGERIEHKPVDEDDL